jgi:hypothetical protein
VAIFLKLLRGSRARMPAETFARRFWPAALRLPSTLGVTWAYASDIRKGKKLPHPRHWQNLAELVGTAPGGGN